MPAHGLKAAVDFAPLASQNFVQRRLHIVVNAALGNAAKGGKRSGMCVKQHLVALARLGHQPEGAAGAQFGVGQLYAPAQPANEGVLSAPVKLEGFAVPELQRDERAFRYSQALACRPSPREGADLAIPADVAQRTQVSILFA